MNKLHSNFFYTFNRVFLCKMSASAFVLNNTKTIKDERNNELYQMYKIEISNPKEHGEKLLRNPHLNKGMAFSLYERQYLGIHGLIPPAIVSQNQQVNRVLEQLNSMPNDLSRYVLLNSLQSQNEKLYYRVICDNVKELMPIVYTPTVGLACQKYGSIYRQPKGIFITIYDNSVEKIYQILSNLERSDIKVIVVTDGERILGLGDLGAYGIGIPVGKLALYVALAGVRPEWCLPVVIDVGTDNKELLNDPYYIGLKRNRVRSKEYDQLIDNFMKACVKKYGQKVLIQFEDFANRNAYRFLEKYKNNYCMFNDDIQGTACVALAGLLATTRVTKKNITEMKFLFLGAGEAATGVADLIVEEIISFGNISKENACKQIYLVNSKGLITKSRTDIKTEHLPYAKDCENIKNLLEIIKKIKPDALIGLSTVGGAFNEEIIKEMAKINQRPIIFALSNPTNKSECTAEDAYKYTNGNVLFASGSPFNDITFNRNVFQPRQGNNAYVFPGIGLGVSLFEVATIGSSVFLNAARTVANLITEDELRHGSLYPKLSDVRELSIKIAKQIGEDGYNNGTAKLYPEPENKELFVRSKVYDPTYDELVKPPYDWPKEDI